MKTKIGLAVLALALGGPVLAQASHYVDGYTTRNGTYVAPHMQTNPDSSRLNNWSTQGNVNPYTGQQGTVNPYAPPKPYTGYHGYGEDGSGQ